MIKNNFFNLKFLTYKKLLFKKIIKKFLEII